MIEKEGSSSQSCGDFMLPLVQCETALPVEPQGGSTRSSYQEPSHSQGWSHDYEFGMERNERKQHSLRMGFCVTEYKVLISDFTTGQG